MKNRTYTIVTLLAAMILSGCVRLPAVPLGTNRITPGIFNSTPVSADETVCQETGSEPLSEQNPPPVITSPPSIAEEPEKNTGMAQTPKQSTKSPAGYASPKPQTPAPPPTPAPVPPPELLSYPEISDSQIRLINDERKKRGLVPFAVVNGLADAALWAAKRHLQSGEYVSSEEMKKRLEGCAGLDGITFANYMVTATGSYGDDFLHWFAGERTKDIGENEGLRKLLLDPDLRRVGVACVGTPVYADGKQRYRLTMVWVFMPAPPQTGIVSYDSVAAENIALLNIERQANGLEALDVHPVLRELALRKAEDLIIHDYFAHESPTYGTPHNMILQVVKAQVTAENLWTLFGTYHATFMEGIALKAHSGLMGSEGHRKNILNPGFTHVGAACAGGVVKRPEGAVYKVVLVQLFIKE